MYIYVYISSNFASEPEVETERDQRSTCGHRLGPRHRVALVVARLFRDGETRSDAGEERTRGDRAQETNASPHGDVGVVQDVESGPANV